MRWRTLLLFLLVGLSAKSQTTVIGEVRDSAYYFRIDDAVICDEFGKVYAHTDSLGQFTLRSKKTIKKIYVKAYLREMVEVSIQKRKQSVVVVLGKRRVVELPEVDEKLPPFEIDTQAYIPPVRHFWPRGERVIRIGNYPVHLLRPYNSVYDLLRGHGVEGLITSKVGLGGLSPQFYAQGINGGQGQDITVLVDDVVQNRSSHVQAHGYTDLQFIIPEVYQYSSLASELRSGNFSGLGSIHMNSPSAFFRPLVSIERTRFNTSRVLAMVNAYQDEEGNGSAVAAGEYFHTDGPFSNNAYSKLNLYSAFQTILRSGTPNSPYYNLYTHAYFNISNWDASGIAPLRSISATDRFSSVVGPGGESLYLSVHTSLVGRGKYTRNDTYRHIKHLVAFTFSDFSSYTNNTFYRYDTVNGDLLHLKENRKGFTYEFSLDGDSRFKTGVTYDKVGNSGISTPIRNFLLADMDLINMYASYEPRIKDFLDNKLSFKAGIRVDQFINFYTNKSTSVSSVRNEIAFSPNFKAYYNIKDISAINFAVNLGYSNYALQLTGIPNNRIAYTLSSMLSYDRRIKKNNSIVLAIWNIYRPQEQVFSLDYLSPMLTHSTMRYGGDINVFINGLRGVKIDFQFHYTYARFTDLAKGVDYVPYVAPITSFGGLKYKVSKHLYGNFRYRYMGDRPLTTDNSFRAKAYFVVESGVAYTTHRFELGLSLENILNTTWNESEFAMASRLKNETQAVMDIHATPGLPRSLKVKFSWFLMKQELDEGGRVY